MHRYFILHKPVNMVSQFISSHEVNLLGNIDFAFPEGIHAIGRLDNHSEGLLILTTNKTITKKLFQGEVPHTRKYLVQVRHAVNEVTLQKLREGVSIRVRGGDYYTTLPCKVDLVKNPYDYVEPKEYAVEYEATTWLTITLTEGKFHQVRKMVDIVGHKCKRLIRIAIEDIYLGKLPTGKVIELAENDFFTLLRIKK